MQQPKSLSTLNERQKTQNEIKREAVQQVASGNKLHADSSENKQHFTAE